MTAVRRVQQGMFNVQVDAPAEFVPQTPAQRDAARTSRDMFSVAVRTAGVPALPARIGDALDIDSAIKHFDQGRSEHQERGKIADRLRSVQQLMHFGLSLTDAIALVA
jgi:hypothetical protein